MDTCPQQQLAPFLTWRPEAAPGKPIFLPKLGRVPSGQGIEAAGGMRSMGTASARDAERQGIKFTAVSRCGKTQIIYGGKETKTKKTPNPNPSPLVSFILAQTFFLAPPQPPINMPQPGSSRSEGPLALPRWPRIWDGDLHGFLLVQTGPPWSEDQGAGREEERTRLHASHKNFCSKFNLKKNKRKITGGQKDLHRDEKRVLLCPSEHWQNPSHPFVLLGEDDGSSY